MINFDVVDRDGEIVGRVDDVNLGRTCILVEARRGTLFGRKRRHAVHLRAVEDVDPHGFKITLNASKADVDEAPETLSNDTLSETALARYYDDRLAAQGAKAYANDA